MITGIKQIHIQVENIERAINFYQNILGLELTMSFPDQNMAFFDCNGIRLYLGKNPEYESKAFIYYQTDNLQQDFEQLKANQVMIIKEPMAIHQTIELETWLCAFKDSEGNILHLIQDKKL
ncbi:MAG: VOC family protein [Gammaproteobacteria bacterium]|nr:VOC family protein [Gammaproteobacteria bacterium]